MAGVEEVMETTATVDELFQLEYTRLVRSLAVAFDAESAADAVQEAFIAADERWIEVGVYDDPAAWVRRVAINRLLNDRRNRRRRAEILATIRVVEDDDLSAELLDLRRAVAALPEQMRLSVCLHYLADLSVDEVASTLAVSPGTVKSNLHDARTRLRSRLEEAPHG
ncbi:MAG: sigma-70 family RNA polymerase sigma factor [Actinomycetota bacterium]|nr:sigma-70 family RNA polymerase sigma factor [Actinomycetota bacterium]